MVDIESEDVLVDLMPLDKSKLHEMYPQVAACCDMFEAAHSCLPQEMYNDPQEYTKTLNEKAGDFCKHLLNKTQLFNRYYELVSYIGGFIVYQEVYIDLLKNRLKETEEKLSRYENND